MAGFFGLFDYTKPGKGVEKDAPQKHPFFVFWELYWRKMNKFVIINFIYFIILLPIIAFAYNFVNNALGFTEIINEAALAEETVAYPGMTILSIFSYLNSTVFYVLIAASALLYGPVTCGFTYIIRNYARDEHAWLSDFFIRTKNNFLQGLIIGLIEIAALVLVIYNYQYTGVMITQSEGNVFILFISRYLSLGLFLVFLLMRNYFYMMIVTFNLKIRQILKNAWFFSVLGLMRNIIVLAVQVGLLVLLLLMTGLLGGILELFILAAFIFSFGGFVSVYTCYPVIKKYMIDPRVQTSEAEETEEAAEDVNG